MERRDFIKTSSATLLAATLPQWTMGTVTSEVYDAIIIGGSFSGLSAALGLGRARMRVLVIDTNEPCNARVPHAHNLLTHDGEPPHLIRAKARADVEHYDTVHWSDRRVVHATGTDGAFVVRTEDGAEHRGSKMLLALGVRDTLPAIPGFADCWGVSAAACPFCHGYEVRDRPIAVFGNGPEGLEYVRLLRRWSRDLTLVTNGPATFDQVATDLLRTWAVPVEEAPIVAVHHHDGQVRHVELANGQSVSAEAIFAKLPTSVPLTFAAELGCALTEQGLLQADPMQRTMVPGVFASGDCASPMRSLSMAIATGGMAAGAIVHALLGKG